MKEEIEKHISELARNGVTGGRGFGGVGIEAANKYIDLKNESNALDNFLDEYKELCEKHDCYLFGPEEVYVRFLDYEDKFRFFVNQIKGD